MPIQARRQTQSLPLAVESKWRPIVTCSTSWESRRIMMTLWGIVVGRTRRRASDERVMIKSTRKDGCALAARLRWCRDRTRVPSLTCSPTSKVTVQTMADSHRSLRGHHAASTSPISTHRLPQRKSSKKGLAVRTLSMIKRRKLSKL